MRTRWTAFLLAAVAAAHAGEAPPEAPAEKPPEGRSGAKHSLVSLDLRDRPLSEATDYLARLGGVNIVPAKELAARRVTIQVVALDWRKALRLVADQAGAYVDEVEPNLIRLTDPPRVTYTTLTDGNDIKEILTVIADYAGANIVISEGVRGKVNLHLKDVPWKHAVQQAVKAAGDYAVVEEEFNLLRIVPSESLRNQIERRVFPLRYLNIPPDFKATLKTNYALARDYKPDGKPKEMKPAIEDFALFKSLKNVLTPNLGKLDYDQRSNAFIAADVKPVLDEIQRIIEILDVEPVQILVDVKFVTTSNTDLFDFGVDWGTGTAGPSVRMTGGSMLHRLPFNLGQGGFEDRLTISHEPNFSAGDQPIGGPNAADIATAGNHFTFGTLDFTTVQAILRLYKRDVESKIVQSPKIITLDNEEATIFVGDTIRYAETTAASTSSGTLTFVLKEVETPVRTGFQLFVMPHVVPGTGKIMMTVIPESNDLSGTTSTITGFERYSNGTQTIDLPRITSRTVVTKMLLEDGQSVVIGGLLKENSSKSTNKLPLLGDIPILGWLFKSRNSNTVQDNLVIFITPHIVHNAADTRRLLEKDMKARAETLREELEEAEKKP